MTLTNRRLLPAALLGAVTMFVWGAASHRVLLDGAGYSRLPDEAAVVASLRGALPEDGLYFFPSPDFSGRETPEQKAAWEARFRAGPTGMLVYHRAGGSPVSPGKLGLQLLGDVLAAAIAAYVLSRVAAPYWQRVGVVGLLGAFSCLTVSALYWNWYGFPTAFFLAQCVDKVVGWGLAGAVMARWVPQAPRAGPAP